MLGPTFSTLDDALTLVRSGMRIVTAMAAAEPQAFFGSIGAHCRSLSDVTVHCANPSRPYPCFTDDALLGRLDLRVMFLTSKVRDAQGHGRVHYVPQHLSQWVRHLDRSGPADIFWGTCTAPDARGFVTLGPSVCFEAEVLRNARHVVLEVNPRLPAVPGATHVPLAWVDRLIAAEHPVPSIPRPTPDAIDRAIAANVASLVVDGSTIQLGIGAIPNAIGEALAERRDLGVHTEMINDVIMDLYRKGVVTGRRKTLWPGKIVGAFVYGTPELYEFVNQNPGIALEPASVVNDPYRIGRNHAMVSINTAVEVDLTGQVCSESIGHVELSGVGGAAETHIGAQRAVGGRGIIALRSTTKDGSASKLVWELKPGAKVSISRNDVDTIVTEFGVAALSGRSVAERVRALIAVAAPQFREELTNQAHKARYL